jgi:hypothetical protein
VWSGEQWQIRNDDNTVRYYTDSDGAIWPWLGTWIVSQGEEPIPTVTQATVQNALDCCQTLAELLAAIDASTVMAEVWANLSEGSQNEIIANVCEECKTLCELIDENTSEAIVDCIDDAGKTAAVQALICPAPAPIRNTALPIKTGRTTSISAGDDGDLERGRGGANVLTLADNNPYGNTTRFLDPLGGTTFAAGVAIDWAFADYKNEIVIGWEIALQPSATLPTHITNSATFTLDGKTGWLVPNLKELCSIRGGDNAGGCNYAPFNTAGAGLSCTSNNAGTSYILLDQNYINQAIAIGGARVTRFCRYYTFAELGI